MNAESIRDVVMEYYKLRAISTMREYGVPRHMSDETVLKLLVCVYLFHAYVAWRVWGWVSHKFPRFSAFVTLVLISLFVFVVMSLSIATGGRLIK